MNQLINDNDDAIISSENNPGIFVQWGLIFCPGHPILKRTIDMIVYNIQNNIHPNDILNMTGPKLFTRAVNTHHKELYGNILYSENSMMNKNVDIVFDKGSHNYRIYGVDYNLYFCYFD